MTRGVCVCEREKVTEKQSGAELTELISRICEYAHIYKHPSLPQDAWVTCACARGQTFKTHASTRATRC